MKNINLAQAILTSCLEAGVREIVLCAGARNAPFVSILSEATPFKIYSFFEERSAAYFALGRIQAEGRAVAVITTSGTAAAELLPATIEADHQGLPLILITADRPQSYRGSAAPQSIVQPGIYSHFVEKTYDVEGFWVGDDFSLSLTRPLHINVCFDEPLVDGEVVPWPASQPPAQVVSASMDEPRFHMRKPLVIVGGLPLAVRDQVAYSLAQWKRPTYIEGPSNLRGDPRLEPFRVGHVEGLDYDGIIRVGAVPTLRLWRDLENSKLPVVHFSHLPYSGLSRERGVFSLAALRDVKPVFEEWSAGDTSRDQKLESLLLRYPNSEPAWVRKLSLVLPKNARLFVGNSLPIREWDLASSPSCRAEIFANRGVNGIDGVISTFIGASEEEKSNWCLIGDLTALYDLSGPWALRERPLADCNIVIINNGGGKIFERIFKNPLFENRHDLSFEKWAAMWDLEYFENDFPKTGGPRVIEIIPDAAQTENFWVEWGGR